jgi:site-specific recombinase XerD
VNQKGAQPKRYSLTTPSWSEAMSKATELLDGFNPEIALAREQQKKAAKVASRTTIAEAVQMWLDRTEHLYGKGGSYAQYRSLLKGFVLYIVRWNLRTEELERIRFIDQLDTQFCTKWYQSWKLANTVMRQRWNVVRSFFNYLHQQGAITVNPVVSIKAVPPEKTYHNVTFTEQQYNSILNDASWLVDQRVVNGEREVYCRRLHIFLELLRWTGMDIGDAVQFRPEMVDVDGVLRYLRTKTDVQAVVPLSSHMVQLLKEIPLTPDTVDTMPFRYQGNDLASDVHNWSRRIRRAMNLAGVSTVQLVEKSGLPAVDRNGNPIVKSANVKMLRHTFAVGCLVAGVPKENVARMLGHISTDMIDAHYAPWVKGLDDAHIRKVREVMAQAKPKKNLKLVLKQGLRVAVASH